MYPYNNNYNQQFYMQDLQAMKDRIDKTMQQYQQSQVQNPPQPMQPITQNFQLAPNPSNNELESKYVETIDEVKNTFVMKTGVFVNKDFSTLWVKDVTGNVRTFRTEEIIEMDEKDKEIYLLKKQIEEMKGLINNANKSDVDNSNINGELENEKPPKLSNSKRTNAK